MKEIRDRSSISLEIFFEIYYHYFVKDEIMIRRKAIK